MAIVIPAFVASVMPGTGVASAGSLTATINNNSNYEMQLPIKVTFGATVSTDPTVTVYRSTDNGATFDTQGITSFSLARIASGATRASLVMLTGIYCLQLTNGTSSTSTFQILTAEVITSIS